VQLLGVRKLNPSLVLQETCNHAMATPFHHSIWLMIQRRAADFVSRRLFAKPYCRRHNKFDH
jgi:hypothetical protein